MGRCQLNGARADLLEWPEVLVARTSLRTHIADDRVGGDQDTSQTIGIGEQTTAIATHINDQASAVRQPCEDRMQMNQGDTGREGGDDHIADRVGGVASVSNRRIVDRTCTTHVRLQVKVAYATI